MKIFLGFFVSSFNIAKKVFFAPYLLLLILIYTLLAKKNSFSHRMRINPSKVRQTSGHGRHGIETSELQVARER